MLKPRKRLVKAKLKEDKLLTYTAKGQKILDEYGRYILYGVIAVVLIISAGLGWNWSKSAAEKDAAFNELLAREAYSMGDLDGSLAKAQVVIDDFPGTNSAAMALSLKGKIHEQRAEFPQAIDVYRELINNYKDHPYLAFGAYFALGAIYYGQSEYEQSARYYAEAAQRYPDHFNAPVSLVEAGRSLKKISRYEEAKRIFRRVLSDYSKSRAVSNARDELADIEFMQ